VLADQQDALGVHAGWIEVLRQEKSRHVETPWSETGAGRPGSFTEYFL
jgi:hypothetical protein